jgi:hypothetical protein
MSFLGELACSIRNMTSQSFRSLPVLLAGSILVLGLAQGNFNLLFFFTGMFIITPLATVLLNLAVGLLFTIWPFKNIDKLFWQSEYANAEQCTLFATPSKGQEFNPPTGGVVVPAYWMTIMAFFFSYLYFNADNLYNKPAEPNAPKRAVIARQSQSMISMFVLVITAVLFTFFRYSTSCDTGLGIFVSWILGYYLAFGWYSFMKSCGLGRLDDLFGINNQLLPKQSYQEEDPKVCVPMS